MITDRLIRRFGAGVARRLTELVPPTKPIRCRWCIDPLLTDFANSLLASIRCTNLKVSVYWDTRLRSTAATATGRTVQLNPVLLSCGYSEVQRAMRHELAHILVWHRHGKYIRDKRRRNAHGTDWRRACSDLGIPDEEAVHSLPVKRSRLAHKFYHICPVCGDVWATARRLKRKLACARCCRKHAGGQYDKNFRYVQVIP